MNTGEKNVIHNACIKPSGLMDEEICHIEALGICGTNGNIEFSVRVSSILLQMAEFKKEIETLRMKKKTLKCEKTTYKRPVFSLSFFFLLFSLSPSLPANSG